MGRRTVGHGHATICGDHDRLDRSGSDRDHLGGAVTRDHHQKVVIARPDRCDHRLKIYRYRSRRTKSESSDYPDTGDRSQRSYQVGEIGAHNGHCSQGRSGRSGNSAETGPKYPPVVGGHPHSGAQQCQWKTEDRHLLDVETPVEEPEQDQKDHGSQAAERAQGGHTEDREQVDATDRLGFLGDLTGM